MPRIQRRDVGLCAKHLGGLSELDSGRERQAASTLSRPPSPAPPRGPRGGASRLNLIIVFGGQASSWKEGLRSPAFPHGPLAASRAAFHPSRNAWDLTVPVHSPDGQHFKAAKPQPS